MARDDLQLKLRLTEEMKWNIVEAAKRNNRSVNAEIVDRLEKSLDMELEIKALRTVNAELEAEKRGALSSPVADQLLATIKDLRDQVSRTNQDFFHFAVAIERSARGDSSDLDKIRENMKRYLDRSRDDEDH